MKILLLLFLPFTILAQSSFKNLDSAAFMKKIDATLKTTGQDFTFKTYSNSPYATSEFLRYTSKPFDIHVFYNKTTEDNGKGAVHKKWNINIIKSDFDKILVIWKALVDKDADKNQLIASQGQTIGDFTFYKTTTGFWCIKIE